MSNLPADPRALSTMFWKDMSQEDFSVPRVVLAQGMGKHKLSQGKFVYNTGTILPSLEGCKLIVPTKTRVLYNFNNKARCSSDNFYQPSQRIANPVSESCLTCPVGTWGESDLKNKIAEEIKPKSYNPNKPLCNETYNLLMADKNWNLFFIGFQKTQLKAVSEKLFTRLRHSFGGNAPFHVSFDITSHPVGEYYNVEFNNFKLLDEDERAKGAEAYQNWHDRAQGVLARQHKEMDDAKEEEIPF